MDNTIPPKLDPNEMNAPALTLMILMGRKIVRESESLHLHPDEYMKVKNDMYRTGLKAQFLDWTEAQIEEAVENTAGNALLAVLLYLAFELNGGRLEGLVPNHNPTLAPVPSFPPPCLN